MSDTPKTDAEMLRLLRLADENVLGDFYCWKYTADLARQLERELAAATAERDALRAKLTKTCADCGTPIGQDSGPKDGWQLEDGRTVCHACCVKDTGRVAEMLVKMSKLTD